MATASPRPLSRPLQPPDAPVVPVVLQTFPSDLRFTRGHLQQEFSIQYVKQAPSTHGTMNMTTPYVKFDVRTTSPRLFVVKGGRRRAIQEHDAATVLVRVKLSEALRQAACSSADGDAQQSSMLLTGRLLVSYEYIAQAQYLEWSSGWGRLVRGEGSVAAAAPPAGPAMDWKGRNFDMLATGAVVVPWVLDLRPDAAITSPSLLSQPQLTVDVGEDSARWSASGGDAASRLTSAQNTPSAKRGLLLEHLQDEVSNLRARLAEVENESLVLIAESRRIAAQQREDRKEQLRQAATLRRRLWEAVDGVAWVEVAAVGLMLCSTALLALNI
jgi:hypothetical protein